MAALPLRSLEESIAETVEAAVRRALAPLQAEIERLRGERTAELVTPEEAARRLGRTPRTVQRWMRDGRLEVECVAGARLVRLPPGLSKG